MQTTSTPSGGKTQSSKLEDTSFIKTMKNNYLEDIRIRVANWLTANVANISAETLLWISTILLHCSTLPSLLAVLSGLTDRLPPVDMVILTWAGLTTLFLQAVFQRNYLVMITISLGFVAQCVLLALIFFPS